MIKELKDILSDYSEYVYLTGGVVRDFCLGIEKAKDIDLVITDYYQEILSILEVKYGDFQKFDKFLTARKQIGDFNIDLSNPRVEVYKGDAQLPTVSRSSLEKDYKRRDFTVNSLYLKLSNYQDLNKIINYSQFDDINNKLIRVHHKDSFIDDPTRIFRAYRYKLRLGFDFEQQTQDLIQDAINLKVINNLSDKRIYNELLKIFYEKDYLKIFSELNNVKINYFKQFVGLKKVSLKNEISFLNFIKPFLTGISFNDYLIKISLPKELKKKVLNA